MRPRPRGFSLLEVLVAFAIMALALALLYRALGGSADATGRVAGQQQAMLLAQSILDMRDYVGPDGWNEDGQSAGMHWRVSSHPYAAGAASPPAVALHEIQLDIQWSQDGRPHQWQLTTLLPQRQPSPGEIVR